MVESRRISSRKASSTASVYVISRMLHPPCLRERTRPVRRPLAVAMDSLWQTPPPPRWPRARHGQSVSVPAVATPCACNLAPNTVMGSCCWAASTASRGRGSVGLPRCSEWMRQRCVMHSSKVGPPRRAPLHCLRGSFVDGQHIGAIDGHPRDVIGGRPRRDFGHRQGIGRWHSDGPVVVFADENGGEFPDRSQVE